MTSTSRGMLGYGWIFAIAVGLMPLFLAGGCDIADRSSTGPEVEAGPYAMEAAGAGGGPSQGAQSRGEFFPLEVGNRWVYGDEILLVTESYGIGVADSTELHFEESHVLTGVEVFSGREYVVETQEQRDLSTGDVMTYWIRYRQDRAGLYEADVSVSQPPGTAKQTVAYTGSGASGRWEALWRQAFDASDAGDKSALEQTWGRMTEKLDVIEEIRGRGPRQVRVLDGPPGGVLPGEITRLKYTLHPGQEWTVRDVPYFGSAVEGHDVLDLPPGKMSCFRIRVTSAAFGPDDVVLLWYGRDGLLGISAHVQSEVLGPGGQPIGRIILEERLFLERIDLVRPGRF